VILVVLWASGILWVRLRASASGELPRVELNADKIAPRPIEELTAKSLPRDYALAWQTMEQALAENRPQLLDAYWAGFAKDELATRIKTQNQSSVHTRYQDRGHKLDALFYSPAGDAIELRDHFQGEVRILDGDKVIYQEPVQADYIVIMTPGADRWLVRELQALPQEKP
jgi:hypothetical protein